MKAVIAGLAGLSLLVSFSGAADAGQRAKKQRYQSTYAKQDRTPAQGDYIERLADKLPFGSDTWWEQMSRERRGGRPG